MYKLCIVTTTIIVNKLKFQNNIVIMARIKFKAKVNVIFMENTMVTNLIILGMIFYKICPIEFIY